MRRLSARTSPKKKHKDQPAGALPKGTEFSGVVRDLAADGNGIVQHEEGQIFFVPGAWLGEQVRVQVTEFKGRFGFARLVAITEPAPQRVTPPCPYQGHTAESCGGCPWQFMDYDVQLQAKQTRVEQALAKLSGKNASAVIRPVVPSPAVYGYRNRSQLKTDGERLGYLAPGSHRLVDVEDCLILTDKNRQTLRLLRQELPKPAWRPRRKEHLTSLDIDESTNAESVSVNTRLPFQQANSAQNDVMRSWLAGKLAGLDKAQPVLELFAGSGNFTQVIADAGFNKIVAVEVADAAMEELRRRLPAVRTLTCNLFAADAAERLYRELPDAEVLVLDPPRDGLKNDVLKSKQGFFRKKSKLREVFYISCNLATLGRDLQCFVEHGFKLREVQPLDQFPHTPHIELMVHLQKC